jgi:hypothetical protein
MTTPPGARSETHPCRSCGLDCTFHVVDAPSERVPSFLTVMFPDTCWLGWAWSLESPGKLVLVAFCSLLCLERWFADENAPDGA